MVEIPLIPCFSRILWTEQRHFVVFPHCTAAEAHKPLCLICPQRQSFCFQVWVAPPYPRTCLNSQRVTIFSHYKNFPLPRPVDPSIARIAPKDILPPQCFVQCGSLCCRPSWTVWVLHLKAGIFPGTKKFCKTALIFSNIHIVGTSYFVQRSSTVASHWVLALR